jgi:CDP-diacylglycerol--glycerol-3-phosphate 3-phosphatidyltransferase
MSASRVVTSLVFLQLILQDGTTAQRLSLAMLIVIELSDLFDGKLARRWKVTSDYGYMLDAFGDRAAYVAYALAAMIRADMSPLLAYGIIVRDFALFASRAYFTRWSTFVERDRFWTKLNGIFARVLLWCFLATWYDAALQWEIIGTAHLTTVRLLHLVMGVYLAFSYYALALLIRRYWERGR